MLYMSTMKNAANPLGSEPGLSAKKSEETSEF